MTYEKPEALELGTAANVILGAKDFELVTDVLFMRDVLDVVEEQE